MVSSISLAERPQTAPGLTARLAAFSAGLRFADLPRSVVTHTQLSLLDTLGVALAGTPERALDTFLAETAGPGPSRIWWSDRSVEPLLAALANAARARALDYDDIIPFPQIHVATAVVPAVLALAEMVEGIDCPTLLTAIAVGCEIQSRLAAAIAPYFGPELPVMQSSQVFGSFSAAAACGRLLALSAAAMESAFGLALMQASGTQEMVVHAGESAGKSLYAGFSNQAGLQSALLARSGLAARGEAIEGKAGLFAAFYDGTYDAGALTHDLGTRFLSLDRCFKAMPGTIVSHAFAEAAIDLVCDHDLAPEGIESIEIEVGPWGRAMCEPNAQRRAPTSASSALNSIPFAVAKAVLHRRVEPDDFAPAGVADHATRAVAARIEHRLDPSLARRGGIEPGIVALRTADGRVLRARVDTPLGHPARPFTAEDAAAKFRTNAAQGPMPLDPSRTEALLDVVLTLDRAPSLGTFFNLLRA